MPSLIARKYYSMTDTTIATATMTTTSATTTQSSANNTLEFNNTTSSPLSTSTSTSSTAITTTATATTTTASAETTTCSKTSSAADHSDGVNIFTNNQYQQQQQQQRENYQQPQHQYEKHNNYYHHPPPPPPAIGHANNIPYNSHHNTGDLTTAAAATTTTTTKANAVTGLATFNGNSNFENVSNGLLNNGNGNGNGNVNSNNHHYNINNANNYTNTYNNCNSSSSAISLPLFSNKMNINTSGIVTSTSTSSSPVVGKTDVGHTAATSSYTSNSILGGSKIAAPSVPSAFNKKLPQQLHASREDVTSLGGGADGSGGNVESENHSSQSFSTNANNNNIINNNKISSSQTAHPPPSHLLQHPPHPYHHYHHNPPPVFVGQAPSSSATVNGVGCNGGNSNSSNSSQQNLNSILKGSKENLLQNNYCNGSIGGSTTGSETGGTGPGSSNLTELDDPGDGLGPLPPKWETAYTERGELYFIDHNTGTSHWLDPRLSKYQKKSLEECTEDELPYGWEKIEDSLYGTYYIDHVNRKTQYENPVLEAKRHAAEHKQKQQQLQQQALAAHQRPQTPSSSSVLNGTTASIALSSVSSASTLSTVDISQRAMQPPPPMTQQLEQNASKSMVPYRFTRNPAEMQGERITATLVKSARGLGITIVGGDDGVEEFLQIKSIVPNSPAWLDGQLQMGDVLVYVNDTCVLGFTHHEMVNVFQSIMVAETVTLEVCRGYSLPFDPNDPNTEVVTTIAVDAISNDPDKQRRMLLDLNMDGNYNFLDISTKSSSGNKHNLSSGSAIENSGFILMKKPEVHTFSIIKGSMGFGFTIADSSYGQKVKKILDRNCCNQLQEGDILLEINDTVVRNKSHVDVVQILKDCSKSEPTLVKIQRPINISSSNSNKTSPNAVQQTASGNSNVAKLRKNFLGATTGIGNNALFRSKTPTADLYSSMQKEILPIRPKTPLVDTRRARVKTPNMELNEDNEVAAVNTSAEESLERSLADSKRQLNEGNKSQNSLSELDAINHDIPPFMDPYPKMVSSLSERLAGVTLQNDGLNSGGLQPPSGYLRTTASGVANYENQSDYASAGSGNYSSIYGLAQMPPTMSPLSGGLYGPPSGSLATPSNLGLIQAPGSTMYHHHHESCFCYECQEFRQNSLRPQAPPQHQQPSPRNYFTPNYHTTQHSHSQYSPASSASLHAAHIQNERMQKRVNELLNDRRRVGFSPLDHNHHNSGGAGGGYSPSAQQHMQLQHTLLNQPHPPQQHQQIQQHQQQHSPANLANWPAQSGVGYNLMQPAAAVVPPIQNSFPETSDILDGSGEQFVLSEVTLQRQALGFGFRIVGGTEEGSQVTVGHIVPGGAADNDHRITTGDEILSIDGINVVNSSHHKVVSLMGEAALRGQVTMILRRRSRTTSLQQNLNQSSHALPAPQHHMMLTPNQHSMFQATSSLLTGNQIGGGLIHHPPPLQPLLRNNPVRFPYDVIVTRHENEGFGFVIISSSNQYYGSTIGKLIPGSPADRCGELKVGDRIIAVNRIDIAGMSHGDVVNLIKESGLHVRLTIGCPKEGAIINAAPTMPAGSGNSSSNKNSSGLLMNSAQASPGQVSQVLQTNLHSTVDNNTAYFERPMLSTDSNNGSAASSSSTHMTAQQSSPNPLPTPPQL